MTSRNSKIAHSAGVYQSCDNTEGTGSELDVGGAACDTNSGRYDIHWLGLKGKWPNGGTVELNPRRTEMTDRKKIQALVYCQVEGCADEGLYPRCFPLDMVRMFKAQPICRDCYDEARTFEELGLVAGDCAWHGLPSVTIEDLEP